MNKLRVINPFIINCHAYGKSIIFGFIANFLLLMTKIKEKNVGGRPRHPTWEAFYEGLEMANQSHKWAICPNNKKVRGILEKMQEHIISCENIPENLKKKY